MLTQQPYEMGNLIQFFFSVIGIATTLTVYQGDKKESFFCFSFVTSKIFPSLAHGLRIRVQVYFSPETLGEFS